MWLHAVLHSFGKFTQQIFIGCLLYTRYAFKSWEHEWTKQTRSLLLCTVPWGEPNNKQNVRIIDKLYVRTWELQRRKIKSDRWGAGGVVHMLSYFSCHFQLFAISLTVAPQAPLSMGFSRQENWSGLPCPPPGDLPDPWIKPASLKSPAWPGELLTTSTTWEAPIEDTWLISGKMASFKAKWDIIVIFLFHRAVIFKLGSKCLRTSQGLYGHR